MSRGKKLLTGVAAVLTTVAASSVSGQTTNPVPPAAKSIAAGAQLYQKYCKACHGEDATGDGPLAPKDVHPPNLRDAEWKYGSTDAEIFANISNGIGPKFDMKSMKSRMTATDIWNVINYLRSIGPQ